MQKYKQVFIRQFDRTLERWRASGKTIAETEVYRLLHSIKGTAATIGLQEWTDEAALLLKHMDDEGGSELSFADIMRVIAPIVRLRADAADSDFGRSTDEIADGWRANPPIGTIGTPIAEGRQTNATTGTPIAEGRQTNATTGTPIADGRQANATTGTPIAEGRQTNATTGMPIAEGIQTNPPIGTPIAEGRQTNATTGTPIAEGRQTSATTGTPIAEGRQTSATTGTPIAEGRQANATRGTQTADGPHPNAISEAPATAAAMDAETAAAPAKPLVLLVDDDVTLLQMFKERLEAEGCLVLATPFPEKAIRWFYELKPDCIVLDVVLPGHSGYDLLTVLQRSPQLFVPVILMSALHEKSDRMKAYVLGADDFLAKPIDPDEFAVRVLNKIRRKQSIAKLMPSNGPKHAGTGTALAAEGDADQGAEQWRIAILDDDPIIRNLLQRRLKDWRLDGKAPEVRTFADGSAFFEDDWHRRKGNYLLILDRMMPKINGIEVLTRLRADYPADRYRIIMLTGVGEQEEIAQAMRLGTDDYVTKPFRLPELEARMLRFLQGNKG